MDRSVLAAFLDEMVKIARLGGLSKLIAPAALKRGASTTARGVKLPAPASLPSSAAAKASVSNVKLGPGLRSIPGGRGRVVPRRQAAPTQQMPAVRAAA